MLIDRCLWLKFTMEIALFGAMDKRSYGEERKKTVHNMFPKRDGLHTCLGPI